VSKLTGSYPSLTVDTTAKRVVSQARCGVAGRHRGEDRVGPGIVAVAEAVGGAGPGQDPARFGDERRDRRGLPGRHRVAAGGTSGVRPGRLGPTVSRLVDALAATPTAALAAINQARAAVRERVWKLAGEHAPDYQISADRPLVVDLDATLITSHSEKELAAPAIHASPRRETGRPRLDRQVGGHPRRWHHRTSHPRRRPPTRRKPNCHVRHLARQT